MNAAKVDHAVRTEGLYKRYGRTWALQDCTLTLPTGRVAALVGPNGAGKTTLLRMLVGLLMPTVGQWKSAACLRRPTLRPRCRASATSLRNTRSIAASASRTC
jgi:ABC-type branched-subunit amino acid transport system ATPase component